MPRVHGYVDGTGYYIKSAFEGNIVTYQVTPAGEQYLRRRGYRDGVRMSVRELRKMQRRGYVYTGGSGPGEIEPGFFGFFGGRGRSSTGRRHRRKKKQGCGCCAIAFAALLVLPLAGLAGLLKRRL